MINFNRIVGHEIAKSFMRKEIVENRIPNSMIFHGVKGIGKHTMALEVAKILNCENENKPCNKCFNCKAIDTNEHPDVITIDPQANLKKGGKTIKFREVIDKIIEDSVYKPSIGKKKIVIIDDASFLSVAAMNNLLKIVEEPPEYMHIILITQNIEKILPTIQSRSQLLKFNSLKENEMSIILKNMQIDIDEIILSLSNGSIGEYLYLKDQHFKKFLKILDIIMDTILNARDMSTILNAAETISKQLSGNGRENYLELKEFFIFVSNVLNLILIQGKLYDCFKNFYHTVFALSKSEDIKNNINTRILIVGKAKAVIDSSVKAINSYVNIELILVEFIRLFGGSFRGIL